MKNKLLIQKQSRDKIRWRSHEPSRLETFSDAVFAFALTLIVVSLEVPKSFDELADLMKGAVSFGLCFVILFMIWNNQNIFFRRFGLHDRYTVILNGILLFVSLIYVYPLKFLTTLFTSDTYIEHGKVLKRIDIAHMPALMVTYSAGYLAINLLFFLMYKNAEHHAVDLELSPKEFYETRTTAYINLIIVSICCLSIFTSLILPANLSGISGFVYFLIAPAYTLWFAYRGKKSRKMFGE